MTAPIAKGRRYSSGHGQIGNKKEKDRLKYMQQSTECARSNQGGEDRR